MNDMNKKRRVSKKTYLLPVDPSLLPDQWQDIKVEDGGSLTFDNRWPRFEYRRLSIGEWMDVMELSQQKLEPKELKEKEQELFSKIILGFKGDYQLYTGYPIDNFDHHKMLLALDIEDYQAFVKTLFNSGEVTDSERTSFLPS